MVQARPSSIIAGWIVGEGEELGVRVAPWVIKKEESLFLLFDWLSEDQGSRPDANRALASQSLGEDASSSPTT